MTLTNDTLSNNSATHDSGLTLYFGTVTLTNVTLSGNSVTCEGGGIYNEGGGIYNGYDSTMTLTNVTLSGNSATYEGGTNGSSVNDGTVTLIKRHSLPGTPPHTAAAFTTTTTARLRRAIRSSPATRPSRG